MNRRHCNFSYMAEDRKGGKKKDKFKLHSTDTELKFKSHWGLILRSILKN